MMEDSSLLRTIGPVVYVDEPTEVDPVFKKSPQTGVVIVCSTLPPEVFTELPNIHRLAKHHSSRTAFDRACKNTHLQAWMEGEIQALGPAYSRIELYRDDDVRTGWHLDLVRGRRRAFIQIDGSEPRFANPKSPIECEFRKASDSQPHIDAIISPDDMGLETVKVRQGQMAVFGSYGLHVSGVGGRLRGIAI